MRTWHVRTWRDCVCFAFRWKALVLAAMLAATFVTAARVEGQAISSISQTRKLYVDQFSEGEEAAQLRDSLIKRLGKSGRFQVVEKQGESDAVVKASGEIWVKGHLTVNSRAPAKNRAAVYGGFLSVEMVAKDGEPLWSYLVTPSKFSWTNIRDDLANNLVKEMLLAAAANNAVTPGAAPTQNLAKAGSGGCGSHVPGAALSQMVHILWATAPWCAHHVCRGRD